MFQELNPKFYETISQKLGIKWIKYVYSLVGDKSMKTMKQRRWIVGHQEKICLLSLPKKDKTQFLMMDIS